MPLSDGFYLHPKTKRVTRGKLVVLQHMGTMPDGKLHLVAGQDEDTFNLEEGDQIFTAIFAVDPFKQTEGEPDAS